MIYYRSPFAEPMQSIVKMCHAHTQAGPEPIFERVIFLCWCLSISLFLCNG